MPSVSVLQSTLDAKVIVDPVIHMNSEYTYKIEKAGTESTYVTYTASSLSTTSANITVNTQGNNVVLDRKLILKNEMQFDLVGTPPAGSINLIPPSGIKDIIALRFYPIQMCTSVLSVKINGASISFNSSQILDALHRYSLTRDELEQWSSMGPCMHDNVADYSDGYGTNINVLGDYYTSNSPVPRGCFEAQILSNTPTTASIVFSWAEPIIISPFLYNRIDQKGLGFLGADTQFLFTYGDLTRCLSIDSVNGPVITSIVPSFVQAQSITARWVTPPYQLSVSDPQLYPYEDFQSILVTEGNQLIGPGGSNSITTRVTSFSYVPSKMLIYVQKRQGSLTYNDPDSYLRINNITINFNNKAGILSPCDSLDLYLLSIRNGLKMTSWQDWNSHSGSVLMLDFARDIPMKEGISVDMIGNYSFYCTINFTNLSSNVTPFLPSVYVVPIMTGILTIQNLSAGLQLGLVDPGSFSMDDIKAAETEPLDVDLRNDFIEGGAFGSRVKNIASKAVSAAKTGIGFIRDHKSEIHDAIQKALPYVKTFSKDAGKALEVLGPLLLGLGCDCDQVYDMFRNDAGFSPMELRAAGLTVGGGELSGGSRSNPRRIQYNKFY